MQTGQIRLQNRRLYQFKICTALSGYSKFIQSIHSIFLNPFQISAVQLHCCPIIQATTINTFTLHKIYFNKVISKV